MKAVVHADFEGIEGLSYRDIEDVGPSADEVKIKLKAVGLNHRDLFVLQRHLPTDPPLIIGSDGAGIIESIGAGVKGIKVGEEVIINPSLGWRHKSDAPPQGFEIIGYPGHGTFAEQIVVPKHNIARKPSYLTWEEAGVIPIAATTAYRVLFTRGRIQPGMKVLISGIGGGVATYLMQFAKAAGAVVYVTSRSKDKCKRALELGADYAIDSNEDWNAALGGEKMDLVIESVGAATFNKSLEQLRPGGTLVSFGASAGDDIQINIRNFFYGQFNLLGSTMGSTEEFKEMLHFIEKHQIRPVLDRKYSFSQFKEAFERMSHAEQFGKIVFDPSL